MKSVLVGPPHYYLSQTLGVPRLVGYLRARGRDVLQRNVDAEIYDHLFAAEYQDECIESLRGRLAADAAAGEGMRRSVERFNRLRGPQLTAAGILGPGLDLDSLLERKREVAETVEGAHVFLREEWTRLDPEDFERCLALANLGALEAGGSLEGVPNVYCGRGGRFLQSEVPSELSLDEVATPLYENLRPGPVLAVSGESSFQGGAGGGGKPSFSRRQPRPGTRAPSAS